MRIEIEIRTDNYSFKERYSEQLREILDDISFRVSRGEDEGNVRDINGNRVGTFRVYGVKK